MTRPLARKIQCSTINKRQVQTALHFHRAGPLISTRDGTTSFLRAERQQDNEGKSARSNHPSPANRNPPQGSAIPAASAAASSAALFLFAAGDAPYRCRHRLSNAFTCSCEDESSHRSVVERVSSRRAKTFERLGQSKRHPRF